MLTVAHLDVARSGLILDARWTKNRKDGFQPLPMSLAERLHAFSMTGEAAELYRKHYARKDAKPDWPENPLLYVPSHTARELDDDLAKAGIKKHGPGGKLDFHAGRTAYVNLVLQSGVTVKEAQTLARHSTTDLTMNVYGRTREERLVQAVEKIAEDLFGPAEDAHSMHSASGGAGQAPVEQGGRRGHKYRKTKGPTEVEPFVECANRDMEAAGIEPASEDLQPRRLHACPATRCLRGRASLAGAATDGAW
jgi:hypothetical protein